MEIVIKLHDSAYDIDGKSHSPEFRGQCESAHHISPEGVLFLGNSLAAKRKAECPTRDTCQSLWGWDPWAVAKSHTRRSVFRGFLFGTAVVMALAQRPTSCWCEAAAVMLDVTAADRNASLSAFGTIFVCESYSFEWKSVPISPRCGNS